MKLKLPLLKLSGEPAQKLPSKARTECSYWKQIIIRRTDPCGAVQRHAASAHDAVQMIMIEQGLAPGMQHRGHPQSRSEASFAELQQRGARRFKDQLVERRPVL